MPQPVTPSAFHQSFLFCLGCPDLIAYILSLPALLAFLDFANRPFFQFNPSVRFNTSTANTRAMPAPATNTPSSHPVIPEDQLPVTEVTVQVQFENKDRNKTASA